MKIPGFDEVMVYAIIQDADTNYNSTFQSIQNLLSVNHQPVPTAAEVFVEKNGKRVGIFIMPSHGSTGMLEDLYLQTLGGTPVLQCIDSCITDFQTKLPVVAKKGEFALSSNIAKARTLGTLMATAGPHNRLGHAAMDGYWDLNHIAMRSIRQFIKEL